MAFRLPPPPLHSALRKFASTVKSKMVQVTEGSPEDQLRAPFETFMRAAAQVFGQNAVCTGETPLPDHLGRPDYAVHLNQTLVGYVELKAPGIGAVGSRFKGRNRDQFKRFSSIPNILYTDGNEWALYRNGKPVGRVMSLAGEIVADGSKAVTLRDAHAIEHLLRNFLSWQPFILKTRSGKIDLKAFAVMLAPLCRLLRSDVADALKRPASPLVQLAQDWRQLLFPDATDDQFADAYAQTVTFALLLGRSESVDETFTLQSAEVALAAQHSLLARALQVLTDPAAHADIAASLDLLLRVIKTVPPTALTAPDDDPWLYFYEDFLAVYDPDLRKNVGVYYTPVQVVNAQVRLIDELLAHRLGKPLGFADTDVVTLDPAVGTGTYLLGVIKHALGRVQAIQGAGAVTGQATALAGNLYGFELMVGAYSVAELRVSRALLDFGAQLPVGGTHVYLTDSLESPHTEPPQVPLYLSPISDQHARALQVKNSVPVIVCLGNPPYDRHEAASHENKARTGGWVRWGDDGERIIFDDFRNPVADAGHGGHLKNLYNQYVYFWRWALWKVFEHDKSCGPGVISFISASSYLDGDAFSGMREHMRQQCDDIWIIDLGGEGRGTRKSENVFAIQTPVAIAVTMREKEANPSMPASVRYTRIEGTRDEKLSTLDAISCFSTLQWQNCPTDWHAPFRPAGQGVYFDWPLLTDLMPWQHSGVQLKRTWPIAPDTETLERRWHDLLSAEDKSIAFRETGDRTIHGIYDVTLTKENDSTPISRLSNDTPVPEMQQYAFRSLDRQWVILDGRLISRSRPVLWRTYGERQVYVTSMLTTSPLGEGPALTACATVPDLHHFSGRGAKDTIPLYRASDTSQTNILPGLLDILSSTYQRAVVPEDFLAYVYGVLAQPAFTERFAEELETRDLRVPITKDAMLFEQARTIGSRLLWLHTYGERFVSEDQQRGRIPTGAARCIQSIPGDIDGYPEKFSYADETRTLHIGEGAFAPVDPEIYEYEVSGLKVVQSWLKYRMRKGAGRKSSPLDDIRPTCWTSAFTTELLSLLWVLEATVALYPEQERLLKAIADSAFFQTSDLPTVPDDYRQAPSRRIPEDDLVERVRQKQAESKVT